MKARKVKERFFLVKLPPGDISLNKSDSSWKDQTPEGYNHEVCVEAGINMIKLHCLCVTCIQQINQLTTVNATLDKQSQQISLQVFHDL